MRINTSDTDLEMGLLPVRLLETYQGSVTASVPVESNTIMAGNYAITSTPATLTVTVASVIITATGPPKIFGTSLVD